LVDRWESYGIAAQVVQIPPTGANHVRALFTSVGNEADRVGPS
jgi:hypothetical protein